MYSEPPVAVCSGAAALVAQVVVNSVPPY